MKITESELTEFGPMPVREYSVSENSCQQDKLQEVKLRAELNEASRLLKICWSLIDDPILVKDINKFLQGDRGFIDVD